MPHTAALRLEVSHLTRAFAGRAVVDDVSLAILPGQVTCLLGPSGCGKSTTLRMIAGLEYPTGGLITLGNEDVTYRRPRERDIAMVFQLFALYPHMGVRDNLEFPLRNEGLPRAEINRRITQVAGILRIEHLLTQRIGALAGGDRQRVALGRAIVRQPQAFLMDEPLGTLDAEFRELMCVELRTLHDRLKTTTVFVTHDQNEAMALADHIVVMNKGDILQADNPSGIYNFPASTFVARFIGRPPMNLLQTTGGVSPGATCVRIAHHTLAVPAAQTAASSVLLGVRPEHVRLTAPGNAMDGHIQRVEYFGSHWIADLQTPGGSLKVLVDKGIRPVEGEAVGVDFKTERVLLFDANTQMLLPSATTCTHQPSMRHG